MRLEKSSRFVLSLGLGLALNAGILVGQPAAYAANSACPMAASSTDTSCTFTSTGAEQTFMVPAGLSSVHVVVSGASGGQGRSVRDGMSPAGRGAVLVADIPVRGVSVLHIEVGGNGSSSDNCCVPVPGGFNGGGVGNAVWGGSGGGASDIRSISRNVPGSLGSRLVVTGGGGGGGGIDFASAAGSGGDAGRLVGTGGGNGAADDFGDAAAPVAVGGHRVPAVPAVLAVPSSSSNTALLVARVRVATVVTQSELPVVAGAAAAATSAAVVAAAVTA